MGDSVPVTKNVNVNIGRAPTDESIRIYSEFKEKAFDSILESFNVTDNKFNYDAIFYQDFSSFGKKLKFRFFLNGVEYTGEIETDACGTPDIEEIHKRLSDEIARQILISLLKKCEIR